MPAALRLTVKGRPPKKVLAFATQQARQVGEIANQNTGVTITNNEIDNNLGWGVGADPRATGTSFRITGNKISNNGVNPYGLSGTGIQESGDCFTQ